MSAIQLYAKSHMSDDELDEALAESEDIRETAERELQAHRSRQKVIDQLERDKKDALIESYARMTPEGLDDLTPKERRDVYKMLRIKVIVYPNGGVEVSGALRNSCIPENQYESVGSAKTRHPFRRIYNAFPGMAA